MSTRIIVLTSTALRHKYFANCLTEAFDVIRIFAEEKDFNPVEVGSDSREQEILSNYFSARAMSEEKFFSSHHNFYASKEDVIWLTSGEINDNKIVDSIIKLDPEFMVVFGTGIICKRLINAFLHRIINMHLGLSPYYRGSGTNFWALYDGNPECFGVTIHFLDGGIDSGPVILQGRPQVSIGDSPHDLGNKTIIKGTELMIETLQRISTGGVSSVPLKEKGRLCLRKHFKAKDLTIMLEKFENGLIEDYMAHKDRCDKIYPIVEYKEK